MRSIRTLLISLRNGMKYEKWFVTAPYSVLNYKILSILLERGFIINFFRPYNRPHEFHVVLRSSLDELFKDLKFFSPRSVSAFRSYRQLPALIQSTQFGIITTDRGLLTLEEAYKFKVGGRLIFTI